MLSPCLMWNVHPKDSVERAFMCHKCMYITNQVDNTRYKKTNTSPNIYHASISHAFSSQKIMKDINVEFGKPQHTVFIDRYGVSDNLTFNFKKAIGKGAFGVVVEVELKDKRRTALKRMFLDCRYRNRELSTLLKINHPHIVELLYYRTFDWGTEGHYLDLIFELCDTSLEDMVKDKTKLSEETILKFYEQSLDALGYLHSKNIVHRDIKPGNIIIKGEDVKICDFGSAKIINDNDYNEPYICTRYYRSPENLMGRELQQ